MEKRKYKLRPINRIFVIWLFIIFLFFVGITCSFTYTVQKRSIMIQCEIIMQDIFDIYYEKVYHFSDVYMPIYSSDENKRIMSSYFERNGEENLNAMERAGIVSLLGDMMGQDGDILFIALYNPDAKHNFYLAAGGNSLKELGDDIPLGDSENMKRMQLLGRYAWQDENGITRDFFLIKGGAQVENGNGGIFVGYNAGIFDQVVNMDKVQISAGFILANENGVIYDSERIRYDEDFRTDWLGKKPAYRQDMEGRYYFTGVIRNGGHVFTAAYMIPWWEMVRNCGSAMVPFLLLLVCFTFLAVTLYMYSTRQIFRKVEEIRNGLEVIGNNELDYRLEVTNQNDEFDEIANIVNLMAGRLKESVEKGYEMRIRQLRSELSQIQARFNPHFLYNTLEVVRGNLFRNGDLEDADYIEKLSRIFRSITDAAPVVSIREEMSFCSLYMALLQVRYHNAVDIVYDIEANVQECGILAYLIQPAIENYFMHALSEETEYHAMEITCELMGDESIRFIIADNGTGLSEEQLKEINSQLHSQNAKRKGYGLSGIAKRIRLFYGEEYGIELEHNNPCGVRVIIVIPRMTIEEHQRKLGILEIEKRE